MFDIFYIGSKPGLFPHERSIASLEDARRLSRTRYCWVINYLSDYQDFDFLWEPTPWQSQQIHVWPSQHQENGGTYLVPKAPVDEINREHEIVTRHQSVPRLHIKHTPTSKDQGDANTRYIANYIGTMRRALKHVDWEYCWVTSDVCDYSSFDFTWHPSEWQLDMLHVFPSNEQKFGDTFYVHVPSFLEKTKNLKILEWFETLHFVETCSVPRVPMPQVKYNTDSMVDAVWNHRFETPLVQFYQSVRDTQPPTVSLWQENTKNLVSLTTGNATAVVPRESKNYIKTQLYDYPYIQKHNNLVADDPLDIVFISNGESNAEQNWQWLQHVTEHIPNRLVRVDGVTGRAAAYRAALTASHTAWAFCVFAKLEVSLEFDWSWQPDRLQQPKHYIFHAKNPVNHLEYGHQAMIAYNKKLVMSNPAQGLDFTLDQAHEVVPILSGIAWYNNSAWMTWRTAFREVLKLKQSLPDIENQYRIDRWCHNQHVIAELGQEQNAKWSVWGAQDALEYYENVNGDFDELKKSYEWEWLASYAFMRRNLTTDQ